MADLRYREKQQLEQALGMEGGYVLAFTNQQFADMVLDSVGKDIYDSLYSRGSGSKANRLREFWDRESNQTVGQLLRDLAEYLPTSISQPVRDAYDAIVARLCASSPVEDVEAIAPFAADASIERVAKAVRDAISRNEPDLAIDRLHTYVTAYLRNRCSSIGVSTDSGKPLHSLLGEYVRRRKEDGLIQSEMSVKILKSSIAILEAFNEIRNKQSPAHPSQILNHHESLLVLNHVASTIRFINTLEAGAAIPAPDQPTPDDDFPF